MGVVVGGVAVGVVPVLLLWVVLWVVLLWVGCRAVRTSPGEVNGDVVGLCVLHLHHLQRAWNDNPRRNP